MELNSWWRHQNENFYPRPPLYDALIFKFMPSTVESKRNGLWVGEDNDDEENTEPATGDKRKQWWWS